MRTLYTRCPGCAWVTAPASVMWEGDDPDTIAWDGPVTIVCGRCSNIYDISRTDLVPAMATFTCQSCWIESPCPAKASLVRCVGCGALFAVRA